MDTKKRWRIKQFTMDELVGRRCRKLPSPYREMIAELMGTFILIMFGIGSVAQFVLGKGKLGGFLSVNFGWGLGVTFGAYWAAGVSGAHLNPSVTLAMVIAGRLPFKKLPFYLAGQTIGAFLASALCYGLYHDLIVKFEGSNRTLATAGIWSTYPSAGVSHATCFGDQVVGTALLVSTIFALTDKRNNAPSSSLLPISVGLLVVVIGISFGINCGYGINPARDLIPRIFTSLAGWKSQPFKANDYWFWIPILGQLCGGVLGAILYIFAIELHHPDEEKKPILYANSIEVNSSENGSSVINSSM